jgi:hypothetical protein
MLADMHVGHLIVTTNGMCQQIRSAVLEFLHADRQTTDMMKLIGAFVFYSSKFRCESVNKYEFTAVSTDITRMPYFVKIGPLVQS